MRNVWIRFILSVLIHNTPSHANHTPASRTRLKVTVIVIPSLISRPYTPCVQ